MKIRLFLPLFTILFITGCTELDTPQTYTPPAQKKVVAPIVEETKTEPVKVLSDFLDSVEEIEKKEVKPKKETLSNVPLSNDNYYKNVDDEKVHSPAYAHSRPSGASAKCRDGTYSFSRNRRGTCSHHGGVATWY